MEIRRSVRKIFYGRLYNSGGWEGMDGRVPAKKGVRDFPLLLFRKTGNSCHSIYSFSFSISERYPAVITPEGSAMIAIPKTEEIMVTILPMVVTG